jgi:hypothetical protein
MLSAGLRSPERTPAKTKTLQMEFRLKSGAVRRRSVASAAGLPQGPGFLLMLIVARGCAQQCSCRITPFTASAVPKAVLWAIKSHSVRASCSDRRFHVQPPAPSALAARLLPHSPPNPTFALLAQYRGLPVIRLAEHAPLRAEFKLRCIVLHAASLALDLLAKPRATGRCQARDAVLTERRRRCVHPAPIWQHAGYAMCLGSPCVVGAVQVAPTPRIRPREVPRHGGGEAHGASKSRPSNLKLALVADRYGLALCTESSRHIWHIRIVNARPGARTLNKRSTSSLWFFFTLGGRKIALSGRR